MAVQFYWLTHDIKFEDTAKGGYSKRYDALIAALQKDSDGWWAQPTSFVVFGSTANRATVIQRIKAAVDLTSDIAVLGMVGFQVMDCIGAVKDLDALQSMAPFAKKV